LDAGLLSGAWPVIPAISMAFVHVEDVAHAHRMAYEVDEAEGRFVLAPHSGMTMVDVARTARRLRPESKAPKRSLPRRLLPVAVFYDWLMGLRTASERSHAPWFAATCVATPSTQAAKQSVCLA